MVLMKCKNDADNTNLCQAVGQERARSAETVARSDF